MFSLFFPTCQVRVVRFYVSTWPPSPPPPPSPRPPPPPVVLLLLRSCEFSVAWLDPNRDPVSSVACWTPTAILRVQCGVPDPNCDPASSVWRAGPQPRSCEFSVASRTPTAILWVSVWRAGPQVLCQKICQKEWQKICQKEWQKICQKKCQKDMSERMSKDMSEDMSERMSEDMSEIFWMSKDMSERMVKRLCQEECQKISQKECQKICQKECQKICQEECQEICQKDMSKRMPEDMSEIMSKDMSERMVKYMSGRMSEDKSERMSKDMSERMSEDMSGRMSGDMSKRYVKKNARRYVRKNGERYVRKYVPSICAYIDLDNKNSSLHQRKSCGWHLVFCFIWHTAASTVGSTLFLCKEVSLVWQPWRRLWWNVPETIFIGTANQVAKGVEHVWRYKLTRCVGGAERMYVCMEPPSTTSMGWGGLWMVYHGRSRGGKQVVCGIWREACSKCGGRARAGEARCSLSYFGLVLGGWSAWSGGETNNVRSRATYADPAEEPQWRASDFMVCTRHEM